MRLFPGPVVRVLELQRYKMRLEQLNNARRAKGKYREIIARLPAFEKDDRFQMNIVNCAMLGAFVLSMPERPEVERLTDYYAVAKIIKVILLFPVFISLQKNKIDITMPGRIKKSIVQ